MDASIFVADGVEECEALITLDILRRSGLDVQTVAVHPEGGDYALDNPEILSSHGVKITCDTALPAYTLTDEKCLIIPGGGLGVQNLKANARVHQILKTFAAKRSGHPLSGTSAGHPLAGTSAGRSGAFLAAICAGPTLLGQLGLLDGYAATVFPGMEDGLGAGASYQDAEVVEDRDRITGRAMGASIPFALAIASRLAGKDKAQSVCQKQLVYPYWKEQ